MVNGEAVAPANGDKQTHRNEMFFMTNEQESSSSKSPGVEHGTFFGKPVLSSTFLNENVCILANFSKLMNIIHFTCCFVQNNLQIGRFSGVRKVWCYKIHSNNVKKDLIDTKNVYMLAAFERHVPLFFRISVLEFSRWGSEDRSKISSFDPEFLLTVFEGPDLLRQFGSVSVPLQAK